MRLIQKVHRLIHWVVEKLDDVDEIIVLVNFSSSAGAPWSCVGARFTANPHFLFQPE
jgi:hypothetical protein